MYPRLPGVEEILASQPGGGNAKPHNNPCQSVSSSAETLPPEGHPELCANVSEGQTQATSRPQPKVSASTIVGQQREEKGECVQYASEDNNSEYLLSRERLEDKQTMLTQAADSCRLIDPNVVKTTDTLPHSQTPNALLDANQPHPLNTSENHLHGKKLPLLANQGATSPPPKPVKAPPEVNIDESVLTVHKQLVRATPSATKKQNNVRAAKRVSGRHVRDNRLSGSVDGPMPKRSRVAAPILSLSPSESDGEKVPSVVADRRGHNSVKPFDTFEAQKVTTANWRPNEDSKLIALQSEHGNKWSLIAQHIVSRTAEQIRHRFAILRRASDVAFPTTAHKLVLRVRPSPSLPKDTVPASSSRVSARKLWTVDDNRALRELRARYSNDWEQIGSRLGRSAKAVQLRWTYLAAKDEPNASQAKPRAVKLVPLADITSEVAWKETGGRNVVDHAGPSKTNGKLSAAAATREKAVQKSVTTMATVQAKVAIKRGDQRTELRRENIALRLALLQATTQNKHAPKAAGVDEDVEENRVRDIAGKAKETNGCAEVTFNPVVEAVLRAKMATAWSLSAMPFLPQDMLVRQSKPLVSATADPHDWSFALLLDFLSDLVRIQEYPSSRDDACKAIDVLVCNGILALLAKITTPGHGFVMLAQVKRSIGDLLSAVLHNDMIDFRWIAVLAANLLNPIVSWSHSNPQQLGMFAAELDTLCASLLEQCSEKIANAKVPGEIARANEMGLAIYEADNECVAKILPSTCDTLFHQIPLLAMLCAMQM